jgi:hypothetical protein
LSELLRNPLRPNGFDEGWGCSLVQALVRVVSDGGPKTGASSGSMAGRDGAGDRLFVDVIELVS